jgi:DNA-binding GntR family transcriptional regulator
MRSTGDHDKATSELSAAESVYLRFRDALVHGHFPPGTRLSERQLSEEYTVSRTPVREALRRLQADGLVQTVGRSLVVRTLTSKEAHDVYRTRAALEALAAELAAERSRDGHVAPVRLGDLRERAEAVDHAAHHDDAHLASLENLRFHKAVAEMGDNNFVIEALDRLWDRIAVSSLSNLTDQVWIEEVRRHHYGIIAALEAGDPAAAADTMREHIERAVTVYTTHEQEQNHA